ncbi:MAG: hypothetical protein KF847_18050 [Pirellulales bacterium]|nr:hypothetical protein [Pirellulales bacterium]
MKFDLVSSCETWTDEESKSEQGHVFPYRIAKRGAVMDYQNRLKAYSELRPATGIGAESPADTGHRTVWTTAQIFEVAWRDARRDFECDRLFNSWYYEI